MRREIEQAHLTIGMPGLSVLDPRREADGRIAIGTLPGRSAPRRAGNLSLDAVEDNAAFLDAVNVSSVALRGAVVMKLGFSILTAWPAWLIAAGAAVLGLG